jgi:ApaG protein
MSPASRLFPPLGTVARLLRELELPAGGPEGSELGWRDILMLARRGFREDCSGGSGGGGDRESSWATEGGRLDAAIAALQVIGRLRAGAACHSATTTAAVALSAAVRVEVTTAPAPGVPFGVQAAARHFPFAYRVTVRNCGGAVVQLVSRHWLFQDSGGLRIEVPKGSPGVVGHTPILEPGQCFEYVSGVELRAPSGTMRGSLHFTVPSSGGSFDAAVAETALQASANVR